jgi:hypothetical protein
MRSKTPFAPVDSTQLPDRPSQWRFWGWVGVIAAGHVAVFSACVTSASLPGTALGNYKVVGTLGTNTCGSGIDAQNPWNFTVSMSKDGTTIYLANSDGSDEVSGTLDDTDSTSVTLISAVTENVDGTATTAGTCNLTLSTTFDLTLGSDDPPKTFKGNSTYDYAVATGVSSTTNCTDQLSSSGGKYATLPCKVTYSLKGTRE